MYGKLQQQIKKIYIMSVLKDYVHLKIKQIKKRRGANRLDCK